MRSRYLIDAVLAVLALSCVTGPGHAEDLNEATEKAMKAASALVAPMVVKIETAGGAEVVGAVRKGTGPTTGLIVDADGYIITSSFNFANKPTDIFVTIPSHATRLVAKIVATDQTRMLTLLKVDAHDLPVPTPVAKKEIEVGLWAMALGRTQDPDANHPPSMSIGIVSALNRIWGKAIQTDAKTSPVNYGGPLVAVDGRVHGIIVPASPRAEGETAGVEWYDSGIGFAIPLEDILAVLPRLKQGQELRRGLLGITPKGTETYGVAATIGSVQPDSAAARAGIKPGDVILAINDKRIAHFSNLQHVLGPLYEGDVIAVKVKRGEKELELKNVKLQGTETAEINTFLGILPMRDDPGPGVEIRYVFPMSPAAQAGLKAGDRVMKIAPASVPNLLVVRNRDVLVSAMLSLTPGTEVKLEIKRKDGDKVETVTTQVAATPSELPAQIPLPSSIGKALDKSPPAKGDAKDSGTKTPDKVPAPKIADGDEKKEEPKKDGKLKAETGLLKRANEALGREYWVYVPENYDANVSHGVIVWFHDVAQRGKDGEQLKEIFRDVCRNYHYLLMGPRSGNANGWMPSETEMVVNDLRAVMGEYTIDSKRIIAHGMGNGGQMAYYAGFNARDTFRGVAVLGAVLGTNPKENIASKPLSFFIAAGDKDPLLKEIAENKKLLLEKRFAVVFREMSESGKEYFDEPTFLDMILWLDSLDRI